jgi:hypothetical protein
MSKAAPVKKLSLNKETIRALTPDQLNDVAGGTDPFTSLGAASWAISILTAGLSGVASAYSIAKTSLAKPQ